MSFVITCSADVVSNMMAEEACKVTDAADALRQPLLSAAAAAGDSETPPAADGSWPAPDPYHSVLLLERDEPSARAEAGK